MAESLIDGAVWGRELRDMDRVIAFAWFALAVAVILGIVGFLRPLWASPNSNGPVVHIGAITAFSAGMTNHHQNPSAHIIVNTRGEILVRANAAEL
jgi:hypothetical protein